MKKIAVLTLFFIFAAISINAQDGSDTIIVQTFTYDSLSRRAVFAFPDNEEDSYEKILMAYSMRCHDMAVGNGNVGCREWDYHCNTVLTDPSMIDSIFATHPSHTITNFGGEIFDYTSEPTYSYKSYSQKQVNITNTVSENAINIGTGGESVSLSNTNQVGRNQFLYTAEELLAAGLEAGEIDGLNVNLLEAGDDLNFMKIRIRATNKMSLEATTPDLEEFQEVYFLNTPMEEQGENRLMFYSNFEWDGTSNIIVEFSFNNGNEGAVSQFSAHESGFVSSLLNGQVDAATLFTGSQRLTMPTDDFGSIDEEITVSFWAFGSEYSLPANTSVCEGVDDNNARQVNIHLPWSNERIYWDCGDDGGYDRIDKEDTDDTYKGNWHHWAFTKNVNTGSMRIFRDGTMWHSGSGKTNPITITQMDMGSGFNNSNWYYGMIDEFRIWDVALESETIQNWMYKSLDESHPNYDNLAAYYQFNEGEGLMAMDSNVEINAEFEGVPAWRILKGENLLRNFTESNMRLDMTFYQGEYEFELTTQAVVDSVINTPHQIITYEIQGTDLIAVDTFFAYQAGASSIVSESGFPVGEVIFEPEGTIEIETLDYYRKQVSRFELLSFITPYGNGLDLGTGKTWTFDVTDYAPILKGEKELSIEGVGNNQEEMDIRFIYIKGTPAREVLSIQNIWPIRPANAIWYGYGYPAIVDDLVFEPRDVLMNPSASSYKVRAAQTGHGQTGEFTPKVHFVNINGGDKEFTWTGWKECGENPVYPQGGTWIYDRAGWCPGMATDVLEFDITEFVSPGETAEIDYGINAVGSLDEANYRPSIQLVTYAEPNFELDAGIVEVQKPSDRVEYERYNSACSSPVVVIENRGTTQLTSLDIHYQVDGGGSAVYTWEGELDFLQTEEVVLPIEDAYFFMLPEGTEKGDFYVAIEKPNGGHDQYCENNIYRSEFTPTEVYQSSVMLNFRTNAVSNQNSYTISNQFGEVLASRESSDLENNTTYEDEIELLEDGCYSLHFNDTGDNGLSFWAQPGQGNGWLRLRDLESEDLLKSFNADFGAFVKYDFALYNNPPDTAPEPLDSIFYVANCVLPIDTMPIDTTGMDTMMVDTMGMDTVDTAIEILPYRLFRTYPNPTTGTFVIELHGYEQRFIELEILNSVGQTIKQERFWNDQQMLIQTFSLKEQVAGIYYLRLYDGEKVRLRKIALE